MFSLAGSSRTRCTLPARSFSSRSHPRDRRAFTLVEVLVATVLTLVLMGIVVGVFASISENVNNSREQIELTNRQRSTMHRLKLDLEGLTAPTLPPLRPDDALGYIEIVEGVNDTAGAPSMAIFDPDVDGLGPDDTTYSDSDDLLMFTTHSKGAPFVGRFTYKDVVNTAAGETPDPSSPDSDGDFVFRVRTIESPVAEVCWFVRGTTLYRRVLLVHNYETLPDFDTRNNSPTYTYDPLPPVSGFYGGCDLSVHQVGGDLDRNPDPVQPVRLVPNTLADLTRRENRYAHQPHVFPHDVRFWGLLGLPTLRECSHAAWPFPLHDPLPSGASLVQSAIYTTDADSQLVRPSGEAGTTIPLLAVIAENTVDLSPRTPAAVAGTPDFWLDPNPYLETDPGTGTLLHYITGPRIAEDVILTNVLGFDIKVWDPGAPVLANDTTGEVYLPGDPGYLTALVSVGSGFTPVSYGAYVDLNYMQTLPDADSNYLPDLPVGITQTPHFHHCGNPYSQLAGTLPGGGTVAASTYDTGSTHYEHDGFNQDNTAAASDSLLDEGSDGVDNDGVNGVDDPYEMEAPPPYAHPLRGIQIKVRVFERKSRQIREVTLVHEFLPQ